MPPLPPRATPKPTEGDVRRAIEIALNKQGIVRVRLNAQYSGPARGGYGGQSGDNVNAARERIAFSPHCLSAVQRSLF